MESPATKPVVETTQRYRSLNALQKLVLRRFLRENGCFFLTGPAGTGKSFVAKIVHEILAQKRDNVVFLTAVTGAAAVILEGETFASVVGWGSYEFSDDQDMIDFVRKNATATNNIRSATHIVLDEISMISGRDFSSINILFKTIRGNRRPFGGVNILFVGDFFQLPPVNKKPDESGMEYYTAERQDRSRERIDYAYRSPAWSEARIDENTIVLTEVMRSAQDLPYIRVQNMYRQGELDEYTSSLVESRVMKNVVLGELPPLPAEYRVNPAERPSDPATDADIIMRTGFMATCKKKRVMEQVNSIINERIVGDAHVFEARDRVHKDYLSEERSLLESLEEMAIPQRLSLKVRTRVVHLINTKERFRGVRIINGSVGVVTKFESPPRAKVAYPFVYFYRNNDPSTDRTEWSDMVRLSVPIVPVPVGRFKDSQGRFKVERRQIPLRVAFIRNIHHFMGYTLEGPVFLLNDRWNGPEYGIPFVMISRSKRLKSIYLSSMLLPSVDPDVKLYYIQLLYRQDFRISFNEDAPRLTELQAHRNPSFAGSVYPRGRLDIKLTKVEIDTLLYNRISTEDFLEFVNIHEPFVDTEQTNAFDRMLASYLQHKRNRDPPPPVRRDEEEERDTGEKEKEKEGVRRDPFPASFVEQRHKRKAFEMGEPEFPAETSAPSTLFKRQNVDVSASVLSPEMILDDMEEDDEEGEGEGENDVIQLEQYDDDDDDEDDDNRKEDEEEEEEEEEQEDDPDVLNVREGIDWDENIQ